LFITATGERSPFGNDAIWPGFWVGVKVSTVNEVIKERAVGAPSFGICILKIPNL